MIGLTTRGNTAEGWDGEGVEPPVVAAAFVAPAELEAWAPLEVVLFSGGGGGTALRPLGVDDGVVFSVISLVTCLVILEADRR